MDATAAEEPAGTRVAAVVVTYARPDALRRSLLAIAAQSRRPDEVHVVDNAGDLDAAVWSDRAELAVHYHRMPENLGYAAGLSVGMRAAVDGGARYCWLLDDDSVPAGDVLERCLQVAGADPGVRRGIPRHEGPTGAEVVRHCDFVLVDGALVTKPAIDDIGLPRADFFMMMEDVEYCRRLRRAGWDVVRLDDTSIERAHLGSGAGAVPAPPWRGYYQTRNQLRMALEPLSISELSGWCTRQAKFLVGAALHSDRRRERIRLRLRGAWDGARGVSGRTVEPTDT
jgi:rhamnopyranosyl-N-acetylglucosaminyl-diphospho-decaprenol beta-1,3/1,4-galactofuranosyltransferase